MEETTKIAIFKGKEIRKTIHNKQWWFVIVDVVAALTDSVQPNGYIKDMRRRDIELSKGWGQIATPLLIQTAGEASTTEIAKNRNAQGFTENKTVAQKGGRIAGEAREKLEKESGKKVSTRQNYLTSSRNKKLLSK